MQTTMINTGDFIQLTDGRSGKAAWIEGANIFALMDDDSTGRPEQIEAGQVVRVISGR